MLRPLLFLLIASVYSCKKDNNGTPKVIEGTVSLEVHAVHHTLDVPAIVFYLKKNATSFPGNDSSVYDYSGTADAYGKFTFTKLFHGNYYVYASGYDSLWHSYVTGNTAVILDHTVPNNTASVTFEVSE